ncbi:MAG TPA: hypothetical protein VK648_04000 [Gemmatimonadaceae bacterium]|nr:MAG: hypothetical protein DMF56_06810 [Acidobacteriota bacterium]HTD82932.1 hypothetical protein [Gemmatimonadaceae bacterium]
MLDLLRAYFRAMHEFRDYSPKKVSTGSVSEWLDPWGKGDRALILKLLRHVKYVTASQFRHALISQNKALLDHLRRSEVPAKKVIYVSIHDAGSSSPAVLNELRDRAQLVQRGCSFVDGHNIEGISRTTEKLEDGAIVYVDDFLASGNQLLGERNRIAEYIIGSFSEFALAVCVCEEAVASLGRVGVETRSQYVHSRAERPLHDCSTILGADEKARLIEICTQIDKRAPLGYEAMATMYILHRNAPNTVPRVLRGSTRQSPRIGLFPRSDDLPVDN